MQNGKYEMYDLWHPLNGMNIHLRTSIFVDSFHRSSGFIVWIHPRPLANLSSITKPSATRRAVSPAIDGQIRWTMPGIATGKLLAANRTG